MFRGIQDDHWCVLNKESCKRKDKWYKWKGMSTGCDLLQYAMSYHQNWEYNHVKNRFVVTVLTCLSNVLLRVKERKKSTQARLLHDFL